MVLAFMGLQLNVVNAQTTLLDQSLLTQESFDTFTTVSVSGAQSWNFSSSYGAVCSGYSGGQSYENEDWLVSPVIDLSQTQDVKLTFSHTRGTTSVMNAGVSQGWYKAFATASYTGNPTTTQWVELEGLNQNITTAWQYIPSGELVIPQEAKSATSRIAFRYMCSATQSATWEIKNVNVTATTQDTAIFKVTNWNTEWLGCTQFGPDDEELQINNVAAAMLLMDSDVYCLQEVINTSLNPSVATLVSIMGGDEWGGAIVPATTGECNQRQAIIYKKSTVQLVSAMQLNNGEGAEGNSYYFNWSSGRYPALYNINFIAGNTTIPVSLVNIHSKAEDGDASSYSRRLGGSIGLKTLLDGSDYNTKNLMIIGDFNDYLNGTSSEACNCTDSPYKNFMDDPVDYTPVTQDLVSGGWNPHPVIENIIISNELTDNYVANSAMRETTISQNIDDYYDTTSDHLPVSANFQFSITLDAPQFAETSWAVYPNPVKDVLTVVAPDEVATAPAALFDITGRQINYGKMDDNTINVSALPSGIYILKLGNSSTKFVKE